MSNKYPKELIEFVKENAKGRRNAELSVLVNRQFNINIDATNIKHIKANHKISSGLTGCFPKGHIPANKGKKGYSAPGCEKGWFKKGKSPVNWKPVGSERITDDGYLEIKVKEPNKWKFKHRLIYEKNHGSIDKNINIIFLDGNRLNTDIANLKAIPKDEMLVMNRRHLFYPNAEFTEAGSNVAKVVVATNRRRKKV